MIKRDKNGRFWRDGTVIKRYCIDCNKRISNRAKRCKSCSSRHLYKRTIGKQLSEDEKTRFISKLSNAKIGKKNHRWGKEVLQSTREKISEKLKIAYIEGRKEVWSSGLKIPMNVKIKSSCSQRNIGIDDWNCFSKYEKYPEEFYRKRKDIMLRDKNICAICYEDLTNRNIHIHHINYNKKDNSNNNLITFCSCCHGKTNGNRKFWEIKLKNKNGLNKQGDTLTCPLPLKSG